MLRSTSVQLKCSYQLSSGTLISLNIIEYRCILSHRDMVLGQFLSQFYFAISIIFSRKLSLPKVVELQKHSHIKYSDTAEVF